MTDAQKIQHAADMIYDDPNCGRPSRDIALQIARRLYDLWMKPGGPQRFLQPGEVALKFRQRYEGNGDFY